MSRSPHARRQPRGAVSSRKNAPQVVVRAGKTYACTACGVLVELPDDLEGEWVLVAAEAAPDRMPDEPASAESASAECSPAESAPAERSSSASTSTQSPSTEQSTERSTEEPAREAAVVADDSMEKQHAAGQSASAAVSRGYRPQRERSAQTTGDAAWSTRSRRSKRPQRPTFAGQIIDGLPVPQAGQLDRAFQWVSYQLNVLDRQDSEIKRLKKLLKAKPCASSPCPRSRGRGEGAAHARGASPGTSRRESLSESLSESPRGAPVRHAHQDVNMAPAGDAKQERGPP